MNSEATNNSRVGLQVPHRVEWQESRSQTSAVWGSKYHNLSGVEWRTNISRVDFKQQPRGASNTATCRPKRTRSPTRGPSLAAWGYEYRNSLSGRS